MNLNYRVLCIDLQKLVIVLLWVTITNFYKNTIFLKIYHYYKDEWKKKPLKTLRFSWCLIDGTSVERKFIHNWNYSGDKKQTMIFYYIKEDAAYKILLTTLDWQYMNKMECKIQNQTKKLSAFRLLSNRSI